MKTATPHINNFFCSPFNFKAKTAVIDFFMLLSQSTMVVKVDTTTMTTTMTTFITTVVTAKTTEFSKTKILAATSTPEAEGDSNSDSFSNKKTAVKESERFGLLTCVHLALHVLATGQTDPDTAGTLVTGYFVCAWQEDDVSVSLVTCDTLDCSWERTGLPCAGIVVLILGSARLPPVERHGEPLPDLSAEILISDSLAFTFQQNIPVSNTDIWSQCAE